MARRGGPSSPFPGLIGRSPATERIFRLIENLEYAWPGNVRELEA